jgi:hypothetical protein
MNSDEMGFCKSSRAGKSIRFRNRLSRLDSYRPQPPTRAFGQAAQEARNGPELPHSILSQDSLFAGLEAQIDESPRSCPRIFPFCEDYPPRLV